MECEVTYDDLAGFLTGDLPDSRAGALQEHTSQCPRCRSRLDLLEKLDEGVRSLPRIQPAAAAVLRILRTLAQETRGSQAPEIMTLDEVAAFLRISPDDLGEIVEELPAFEIAGQIRVRRSKLLEWIQEREAAHLKAAVRTHVSRVLTRIFAEGVS